MSGLVIDASIAVDWIMEDEGTPAALAARRHVVRFGAVVPAIWRTEVANALLSACRRGRLTFDECKEALADLERIRIEADPETWDRAWPDILDLAEAHHLTVYDAAYLELAARRGLPLATLDQELRKAAVEHRVTLL